MMQDERDSVWSVGLRLKLHETRDRSCMDHSNLIRGQGQYIRSKWLNHQRLPVDGNAHFLKLDPHSADSHSSSHRRVCRRKA